MVRGFSIMTDVVTTSVRAKAEGRCAGCSLQGCRRRRVVAVGMSYEDVGHGLGLKCREQCVNVILEQRPRIDHGNATPPDHVCAGPVERERAWIVSDDPANCWRQPLENPVG